MERTSPSPHTQNIACTHACEVGDYVSFMRACAYVTSECQNEDKIDCKGICYCDFKEDHADARIDGGSVYCNHLKIFIIQPAVFSVTKYFRTHKISVNMETILVKN
jgi:hypothetical protein